MTDMGIERFLNKTVRILAQVRKEDLGGYKTSGAEKAIYRAAIFPARAYEREMWARVGVECTHVFFFQASASITEDDELEYDGKLFEITSVIKPGEMSLGETRCAHVEVVAKLIKGRVPTRWPE